MKQVEQGAQFIAPTKDIVTKDMEVFYNPEMELNRSLSIEVIKAHFKEPIDICLPLAGSGVRAVRLLHDIPDLINNITINDINPEAVKLIKQNIKSKKATITNTDANTLLQNSHGFDYIDIDPFGSPNFLLDIAIRRVKRNGILAVTATDTAALTGTYPKTTKRKYWARAHITPQKHELGLRILIRKVLLIAMQHEKKLKPIISYHQNHYYRIFFLCERGMPHNYDELNAVFHYNKQTGEYSVDKNEESDLLTTGPLYSGSLQDTSFLKKINTEHKKINKLKESLVEDNSTHLIGHYDMHVLGEKKKVLLKKLDEYIEILKEKGYKASRSAFNNNGIKTDAPYTVIENIVK